MTLILSGTNRPNSKTEVVSDYIYSILKGEKSMLKLTEIAKYIDLESMYDPNAMSSELAKIQDEIWIPADKIIIVSPEYNGSFSGIIKLFIDAISVRKYADSFKGKKVALVGVASGRAGNLRGLEQLTGLLNYLKIHVYPVKVPLSQIGQIFNEDGANEDLLKDLKAMIEDFTQSY